MAGDPEMVERVARAMHETARDLFSSLPAPVGYNMGWDECDESYRRICRLYARATIQAMYVPTRQMTDAAYSALPLFTAAWQAAIDAALITEEAEG